MRYFLKKIFLLFLLCYNTLSYGVFYRVQVLQDEKARPCSLTAAEQDTAALLLRRTDSAVLLEVLRASDILVHVFPNIEEVARNTQHLQQDFEKKKQQAPSLQESTESTLRTIGAVSTGVEKIFKACLEKQENMYNDRVQVLLSLEQQAQCKEAMQALMQEEEEKYKALIEREKLKRRARSFYQPGTFTPFASCVERLNHLLDPHSTLGESTVHVFMIAGTDSSTDPLSAQEKTTLVTTLKKAGNIFSLLENAGKNLITTSSSASSPLCFENICACQLHAIATSIREPSLRALEELRDVARREEFQLRKDLYTVTSLAEKFFASLLERLEKLMGETDKDGLQPYQTQAYFQEKLRKFPDCLVDTRRTLDCASGSSFVGFGIVEQVVVSITQFPLDPRDLVPPVSDPLGLPRQAGYMLRKETLYTGTKLSPFDQEKAAHLLSKASGSTRKAIFETVYPDAANYADVASFKRASFLRIALRKSGEKIAALKDHLIVQSSVAHNVNQEATSCKTPFARHLKEIQKLEDRQSNLHSLHRLSAFMSTTPLSAKETAAFAKHTETQPLQERNFQKALQTNSRKMQFVRQGIAEQWAARSAIYKDLIQQATQMKEQVQQVRFFPERMQTRPVKLAASKPSEHLLVTFSIDCDWCYDLLPFQVGALKGILQRATLADLESIFERASMTVETLNLYEELDEQSYLAPVQATMLKKFHQWKEALEQAKSSLETYSRFLTVHRPRALSEGYALYAKRRTMLGTHVRSLEAVMRPDSSKVLCLPVPQPRRAPCIVANTGLYNLEEDGLAYLIEQVQSLIDLNTPTS